MSNTIKKLPNSLSSNEINDLVLRYRAGDVQAAECLLKVFMPLLGKYLNVIFHARFNQSDANVCKFLELCGKINIRQTAEIIRMKLRRYDADEIVGIAKIALLTTAKQYDNIVTSYGFVLHRYLKAMLWEDHLEDYVLEEDQLVYHLDNKDVVIDDAWVKGETAGEGFSELTELQRLIVKMCYNDGISDLHVASKLKMTPYVLSKEKKNIKDTLARTLGIKVESQGIGKGL